VLARGAEREERLRRAPAPVLVAPCIEDAEEPSIAFRLERVAPEPAPALLGVLGRVVRGGIEIAEVDLHVDVRARDLELFFELTNARLELFDPLLEERPTRLSRLRDLDGRERARRLLEMLDDPDPVTRLVARDHRLLEPQQPA